MRGVGWTEWVRNARRIGGWAKRLRGECTPQRSKVGVEYGGGRVLAGWVTRCRRGEAAVRDKGRGMTTSSLAGARHGGEGVLTDQATGGAKKLRTRGMRWSAPSRRGLN